VCAQGGSICSSPGLRDNGGVADRLEDNNDHPVAYGLLALIGVGVVVGLIVGLGALAGARVAGVGEESADASSGGEASMYLPKPEKTRPATGPDITLQPGQESSSTNQTQPSDPKTTKKPKKVISLSAAQTQVAPMQQIDLSGTYPGGEGAILQVQRFEGGGWEDFPASPVSVSDQTFSTYVLTGISGQQRFRVIDTGSGKTSNEVRVMVTG